MTIKIVKSGEWKLTEVPAEVRAISPLRDPSELIGVETDLINPASPYVVVMHEPPHHYSSVHYHTVAEAMVILQGRLLLNGTWCEPGTIVYIDEGEEYWHSTAEEGCVSLLVRPGDKAALIPGADSRAADARDLAAGHA